MPFPFVLPTTSSFSFSTYFASDSHPSLPLSASTYRGVVRETLKKHKRSPPATQSSHLSSVLLSLNNYIPYLLAVDAGLGSQAVAGEHLDVVLKSTPTLEWRPTISEGAVPGREAARVKIQSLEYEVYFVLSCLAYTYTQLARTSLHPLYSSASASPTGEQRTVAITTATKHLLSAASIHDFLASRSESLATDSPCLDITKSTFRALTSLALAEATFLAVLKDDPYPAAVAQDRNKNDKEWMIKAPEIPKVRAHLYARLCLAAAQHAANASSLLRARAGKGKIDDRLLKYVDDLKRTGRGKACRFFGIDAELGGQTGTAIAWMRAGMQELGLASGNEGGKKGLSLGRFKKEWAEKREDKKVERGTEWGADGGKLEEGRILEMLDEKWSKENDTINTQHIPPTGPLLASMPSGREIHSLKPFEPPVLESEILETMRAPPGENDDFENAASSDEDEAAAGQGPVGAFPGTRDDYAGSGQYY
ncbi:pH-response regulator protein palC [Phlyctema vagabunda]|uniref:pH-response regulator protein palC n=1 Tax=Phlyctema vagabunda TaxID=108571 RepID=A0ABR4P2X4_9HELO